MYDINDITSDVYLEAYDVIFSLSREAAPGKPRKTSTIKRDELAKGYALFCFNIDNFTQGENVLKPQTVGLSKLEIKCGESLTESVTVIDYATYNSLLRVDGARNIKADG